MTLERYLRAITCNLQKLSQNYELVLRHMKCYYAETLVSFTNFADQLLAQILILLKHVFQEPMSLYSIHTIPLPIDTDAYLENSHEYIEVHVQYLGIAVLHNSYQFSGSYSKSPRLMSQCHTCDFVRL